ncbi:hypothetical protein CR513_42375, partial [Mucuna pruriens]
MERKGQQYARSANKGRSCIEWFSHLRRSKFLPRRDGPFKILKKINGNDYLVGMPKEFWDNNTFNVIDLTPCEASVEKPDLRTNSLQEGEDDTYTERENPTLQGPITRGRLRRTQEEVQHQLTTLKDLGEGQGGSIDSLKTKVIGQPKLLSHFRSPNPLLRLLIIGPYVFRALSWALGMISEVHFVTNHAIKGLPHTRWNKIMSLHFCESILSFLDYPRNSFSSRIHGARGALDPLI